MLIDASIIEIIRLAILFGILIGVVYLDMNEGRIPNSFTLTGLGIGITSGFALGAFAGFVDSIWGVLVSSGPFLILYLMGLALDKPLMGAGDVKLMAAIGSFLGPWGGLWTIYYSLWIAGIIALGIIAYCAVTRKKIPKTLPFGSCLAFGTLAAVVLQGNVFLGLHNTG